LTKINNFSDIDTALIIDSNKDYFNEKLKFCNKNINQKFLGLTLNHRLFELREKNIIKAEIEKLSINHLIFSLKPSIIQKIKKNITNKNYKEFQNISQLFFLFQIINKKKIKNILLGDNFKYLLLENKNHNLFDIEKIRKIIINYKKKYLKGVPKKKLIFFESLYLNKKKLDSIKIILLKKNIGKKNLDIEYDFDQIGFNEKNIFWLGFDKNFKEIPWSIKHNHKSFDKQKSLDKLKYCTRCCMPETWEGIKFDDFGICSICKLSEEKMDIDWKKREKLLKKILNSSKSKFKNNYDGVLPISGGKDSTFQAYILKNIYNFEPLAVTHGSNWLSKTGRYNLENCLQKFDLDHLMFIPGRKIVNNVAKKSLEKIGDACWHCHIGVGTFPIQTCVEWNLKLIIYGEAPADTDARGTHKKIQKINTYRFLKESALYDSYKFIDKKTKKKDLSHWRYPNKKEIINQQIKIIHLGQYMFWDEQKNIELMVKYFGWKNDKVENTYKGYKSNECIMAGVHDYLNYLKRGIGRATVHAAEDVRRGLIYREDGFNLLKKYDSQIPHALKYYKSITNYSDSEIFKLIKKSRKKSKYASKLK